jgi:hypothetical protein
MHPAILIGFGAVAGRVLGKFYDSIRQDLQKIEIARQRAAIMANRNRITIHQTTHPEQQQSTAKRSSRWEQLPARRVPWRG